MSLSQAFQEQGQSGQSQSFRERVLTYLSQAWRALDLPERLLYPLMRMLLLLGMLGLEQLARLQSRARQMFLSLESKVTPTLGTLPLQQMQTFLSRVFQRQER
jgi:hypothetical protein